MPFYLQMSTNINSTTRHLKFSYIYKSSTDKLSGKCFLLQEYSYVGV